MSKKPAVTVADVMAKLALLPPDMEVWRTWDESGECFPVSHAAFEDTEYSSAWLKPTVVAKKRHYSGKLKYEDTWGDGCAALSRSAKTVVIM